MATTLCIIEANNALLLKTIRAQIQAEYELTAAKAAVNTLKNLIEASAFEDADDELASVISTVERRIETLQNIAIDICNASLAGKEYKVELSTDLQTKVTVLSKQLHDVTMCINCIPRGLDKETAGMYHLPDRTQLESQHANLQKSLELAKKRLAWPWYEMPQ